MATQQTVLERQLNRAYPYGFTIPIVQEIAGKGLSEETVRFISAKREEPDWLLAFRLKALAHFRKLSEPTWSTLRFQPVDYDALSYYAVPKRAGRYQSLDEVDPAILTTFKKLGIPVHEQKRLAGVQTAMDLVLDSESIATTFQDELAKHGVLFCSIREAVQKYPELVRKYYGKVVPFDDNKYAALNAAVSTDGSFCYIPAGVRCPLDLSTYFRINAAQTGQFERTLIIAEPGSYVSYLEGCTAPMREEHQLHAAVVEIHVGEGAEVRYSTIQNWYPGDADGKGGIYNFVTKRGICAGEKAKLSWTQVETGSALTWKYPSCILKGDHSCGEFYSVALTKGKQQADTGTKMIHLGRGTRSRIISKGISAGRSRNAYRGLVQIDARATNAFNFSQCDSLLLGGESLAFTIPYIEVKNDSSQVQHEATVSPIDEEQRFYCQQRGLSEEKTHMLIATGFCGEVLGRLPLEFAAEAVQLVNLSLEGSVG